MTPSGVALKRLKQSILEKRNSTLVLSTLWFQKKVIAGKKIVWMEDGLNIGNRASGLGPSIKDMDVLLSALKNLEIIQF